eukprot:CAMPEP_0196817842 /NCGR_PEP_ID=MMETSP1362-20130617/62823_1 /TAXON_ID=163516 /ORGANISM="Leptocylindrus danicus, Strain CCMP1856" /LENGTH=550 /DNA_ID=CAMNT_0042195705 /DNA_START=124 /DNA_END=1773 /DNA_ORIENTATION=-
MQRRANKFTPTKRNSSGNNNEQAPLHTRYNSKSRKNNDNYRSLPCIILAGSIISLSILLWFHHVNLHVHTDEKVQQVVVPYAPKKVNGHWEEWVVDDDGVGQNTHHVIDGEVIDDPSEFARQEKEPVVDGGEKDAFETVQGKYFTMLKPRRTTEEATDSMLSVSNENVMGEKKLKNELEKVKANQKKKKDLGVNVLSRWMGDGVPVIVPELADKKNKNTETGKLLKPNQVENKSQFPSPIDILDDDVEVVLKPAFGQHRSDQNAVFAFAEGYTLDIYAGFIESLIDTGYTGDIVLSVSSLEKLDPEVEKYLRSRPNLVVYAVKWDCFKKSGEEIDNTNGGMSDCKMHGMFANASTGEIAEDPREARPVATARYELYWAWSLLYSPHSQILLIDARDTIFQGDPFGGMKPSSGETGILRFFAENADATSLSISSFNKNWLIAAYGKAAFEKISDRPVICSGSTAGEQVAIESYLRAMVLQFDETKCKKKGCDQGFHNYLHYYNKLVGAFGIDKIIVYEQGKGAVNNLGAMKTKPLTEWGLLDTVKEVVLNW